MVYTIANYLRISSEDIDLDGLEKYESYSIVNQRSYLENFIASIPEFHGCKIIEAVDDGRTGTNFSRPGAQRLIDMARSGKVNCIIVKDLSRWGRNMIEVGDFIEQKFPAWGVRFISINDMYDSANLNGGTGGIDIAFRNLIYEMYSQDLSDKVRTGRMSAAKSGKVVAPFAFFGYLKDPADKHKLIIDEAAAEVVRNVFNLAEQGVSATNIARELNARQVPTAQEMKRQQGIKRNWVRSKLNIWESTSINHILRDDRYTGKLIFGKRRRVEIGKPGGMPVPETEWIVVPDAIPVIISQEQFNRVRSIVSGRAPSIRNNQSARLFSRKIKCGYCGHALHAKRYCGKITYYCDTPRMTDVAGCSKEVISENAVTDAVLVALNQQIMIAESIKSAKASALSVKSSADTLRGEVASIMRLIEKVKTARMSLWEKYHDGNISLECFQDEKEKYAAQTAAYEEQIIALFAQIDASEATEASEDAFVERFIRHLGISELTRAAVLEFVNVINVYSADRIEIVWNFADEYEKLAIQMGNC